MYDAEVKISKEEKYFSEFGGVIKKDSIFYAVSNDGEMAVPIPDQFAKVIMFALKAQDRIYNGGRTDLLKFFFCY